jgi:hypothetical protein
MGGAGGEEGDVRPTLKPVAHGECSQPSHGKDASAGPVPELWLRLHPGVGVLPQLPDAVSPRSAHRSRPDRRARGPGRARRRRVRRLVGRKTRPRTDPESGQPEHPSELGDRTVYGHAKCAGGAERVAVREDDHALVLDLTHGSVIRIAHTVAGLPSSAVSNLRRDYDFAASLRLGAFAYRGPRQSDPASPVGHASHYLDLNWNRNRREAVLMTGWPRSKTLRQRARLTRIVLRRWGRTRSRSSRSAI